MEWISRAYLAFSLWTLYWWSRLLNAHRLSGQQVHLQNISASRRLLKKIRKLEGDNLDARVIGHLRTIDPLLFEELILTALEETRRGIVVYRSLRYSGDGGFDGTFWAKGVGRGAVQAKRYSNHINAEHVKSFAKKVRWKNCSMGLFVHTGRTGKASHEVIRERGISLVSGTRLTQLLLTGKLPPILVSKKHVS